MNVEVSFIGRTQTFRKTDYRDLNEMGNKYGPFSIRDMSVRVYSAFSVRPELLEDLLDLNHAIIRKIAKEQSPWQ